MSRLEMQKISVNAALSRLSRLIYPLCAHRYILSVAITFHTPKSKFKTRQPPHFVTLPHALSRLASRLKMQKTSVITTLSRLSRLDYPLGAHEHSGTLRPSRFAPFPQCAWRSPPEPIRTMPHHFAV